jgi:hypothetical protein
VGYVATAQLSGVPVEPNIVTQDVIAFIATGVLAYLAHAFYNSAFRRSTGRQRLKIDRGASLRGSCVRGDEFMANEPQQDAPRTINKQEAVTHLLHAAIRMIQNEEDPYAIHLIVQSADKLLLDLGKQMNKQLAHELGIFISVEKRGEFFKRYRATYNFFKHANKDHDQQLRAPDMMVLNVILLAVCIENYVVLYNHRTDHMKSYQIFAMAAFPGSLLQKDMEAIAKMNLAEITPRDYFSHLAHPLVAQRFPDLDKERQADLTDHGTFYSTPITEIEDRHLGRSQN